MIDEVTAIKNYPLPHPRNIASQDVERIATAISMIDEDIKASEEKITDIEESSEQLKKSALQIPEEFIGKINPKIQGVGAKKYIIVNSDATGFSAVEGGGGAGGKKGEVLIKKSDENFDTTWADPRAILKKSTLIQNATADDTLLTNSSMILADEIEVGTDGIPQQGITPHQVTDSSTLDSFHGYILKNEIEGENEDTDLASKTNFGRVKIGDGFDVNNGVVSVPKIPFATKDAPGVVQIGDGFEINKGVLTAKAIQRADHENFGIVKLSSSFKIGANGELLLASGGINDLPIVYQGRKKTIIKDSIIRVTEDCAYYRAFIDKDTFFRIELDFMPTDDIGFDFEIFADDTYVISFANDIIWDTPCKAVTAGNSIIHFEKDAGSDRFYGNLVQASAMPDCSILTANYSDDIQQDFIVWHNGANWTACRFFQNSDCSNYTYFARSDEGIFQFDFMRTTYIDRVFINNGWGGNSPEYFYIEGSVDGSNWHVLYVQHNEPFGEHRLQKHGYFKHYRLRLSNKGVSINRIDWYGFYINDEAYELENLMPVMSSDEENGYKITSTELYNGALCDLLKNSADSGVCLNAQKAGEAWIQYELPEPKIVDVLDIGALRDGSMVQWYKFEASNDCENWTLLLEKREKNGFYKRETRQFWFENNPAYKYYRLTAMDATPSRWSFGRMRLYKKIDGIASTSGFIPSLSQSSQYGYKITASSDSGSGHYPQYAFDGDVNTKWATAQNDHIGGWICVEFPANTLCNRVWIRARNDGWYYQAPVLFEIQGSMDGVSFETLKTVSDITWTQGEEKVFDFFNEKAFLFYRIQSKGVQNENYFGLSELNFGTVERSFKRELFELRSLTPNMSANSQDGFILTANSIYKGQKTYNPFEAFNGTVSDSSSWTTKNQEGWIQIELPTADHANVLKMAGGFSSEEPDSFILKASNDGINYDVLLDSGALTWTHNEIKSWDLENETAYKFYRIEAVNTKSEYITISEIQLMEETQVKEY